MATWDLGRVVGADGKSATLEITGVQNLPYGSDPVITEEVDSTPLARKYRLGIPAGKPGTNAGGGGAGIDDGSVATDTTYSSAKIESIADQLSEQIEEDYLLKTGTAADSKRLDGKDSVYFLHPRNLLDNSDFRNPVNQRGQTSYTGVKYTIDRWRAYHADTTHEITTSGVHVSSTGVNPNLYQHINSTGLDMSKKYTAAACDSDGNVYTWSGLLTNTVAETPVCVYVTSEKSTIRLSKADTTWVWAALYEGEYTADNLPPYVYKGYGVELFECKRYYEYLIINQYLNASASGGYRLLVQFQEKRINPTISYIGQNIGDFDMISDKSVRFNSLISGDTFVSSVTINADL